MVLPTVGGLVLETALEAGAKAFSYGLPCWKRTEDPSNGQIVKDENYLIDNLIFIMLLRVRQEVKWKVDGLRSRFQVGNLSPTCPQRTRRRMGHPPLRRGEK